MTLIVCTYVLGALGTLLIGWAIGAGAELSPAILWPIFWAFFIAYAIWDALERRKHVGTR
jgi:predicted PurR-regulated permease PerM